MKVIASYNGLAATEAAWRHLQQQMPVAEACVEGVTLVEDDPDEHTVGYGGLPDENGQVTLDAAVMDGKTHRGGSIIGLRDIRHVSRVALRLMRESRRVMLHGEGARKFALECGFEPEDLLSEKARRIWHYWKRTYRAGTEWLPVVQSPEDEEIVQILKKLYRQPGGTVHCAALDARGDLACVTSTSGHSFKTPGRVGDSPIFGAGLYVDNRYGSCGSIGHGEANLLNSSSFLAVQLMAQGRSPRDAGIAVLEHVVQHAPPFELDELGRPDFNLQLFLLAKNGTHAGVCLRGERQMAVTDETGTRLEKCESLLPAD